MNKKTLLVIILAGIFALLGAFAVLKTSQKPQVIEPVKQEEEEIIPIPEPEPVKVEVEETKPEIKKVSYKKQTTPKPVVKELPVIKPIVVKEVEAPVHENVVQEEESKDIVITKEYKVQTPARYTFK